jgi:hypothetical protein
MADVTRGMLFELAQEVLRQTDKLSDKFDELLQETRAASREAERLRHDMQRMARAFQQ